MTRRPPRRGRRRTWAGKVTALALFDYYLLVEFGYSWACQCYVDGVMIP